MPEIKWMEWLIGFAVMLQTLEMLQLHRSFGAGGIWTWQSVRREYESIPKLLVRALDFAMGEREFLILLGLRLAGSIVAPLFPELTFIWGLLWLSTIVIALRWRGTFNGGSDYMTLLVLGVITLSHATDSWIPILTNVCVGYVGLQVALSFFVAGIVKIRQRKWRTGEALAGFLSSDFYEVPLWIRDWADIKKNGFLIRSMSWFIMLFECFFPVILLSPVVCGFGIGLALIFQLINVYVFGLNRFVWAWAAAYPALYVLSLALESGRVR